MIYQNILETIGKTPLVKLNQFSKAGRADIYAKIESRNPGGSIKDRPALFMIEDAEKDGRLKKGDTIVEPTSGNTGVALAMIAAAKGYKLILTMPHTMSKERVDLMKAYGAEVILTTEGGLQGAVDKANELAAQDGYFKPDQFSNPSNLKAHVETTAREILEELTPDAFVAGVGTGGTVSGIGSVLKEYSETVKVYAVEPKESPLLNGGKPSSHKIQGIGGNFVPDNFRKEVIDQVLDIPQDLAIETSREIARKEGILTGISAGANLAAAIQIADELGEGKSVVTVLPDTGERYLSTVLFHEE